MHRFGMARKQRRDVIDVRADATRLTRRRRIVAIDDEVIHDRWWDHLALERR